jgi:DNA polymerase lambda
MRVSYTSPSSFISSHSTDPGALEKLIRDCKLAGIITEDLVLPGSREDETELERVYRGLCRLPNVPGSRRRRIDFLTIEWKAKGAALLYYTVSAAIFLYMDTV